MKSAAIILTLAFFLFSFADSARAAGGQSPVDGIEGYSENAPMPKKRLSRTLGARPMTDAMHNEFMQNDDYALADGLLNLSWKLAKKHLPSMEYEELLDSQRAWVKGGRDADAAALMEKMGPSEAYAKVTMERAQDIADLISARPRSGNYAARQAGFKATVENSHVSIAGDSQAGAHTCDFEGNGRIRNGWIRMEHDGFDDFYLLFTRKGAVIFYNSSELGQGCGSGAGFDMEYRRKN